MIWKIFITIYNEKNNVRNNKNAWNYYFKNLNKFTLNEVYKSKNVLITDNKFFHFFSYNIDKDIELSKLLRNEIIINKYLQKSYLKILKKFDNENVLGIHFRGTSYKRSPGHPLPATKKQILKIIKNLISKEKYDKIFLVTEEKKII